MVNGIGKPIIRREVLKIAREDSGKENSFSNHLKVISTQTSIRKVYSRFSEKDLLAIIEAIEESLGIDFPEHNLDFWKHFGNYPGKRTLGYLADVLAICYASVEDSRSWNKAYVEKYRPAPARLKNWRNFNDGKK